MQSVFWAVSIYGFLSVWIAYIKRKEGASGYTGIGCAAGYLAGRAFVWVQLKHWESMIPEACMIDAAMAILVFFLAKKRWKSFSWEYVWLYVSSPVILFSLTGIMKTGMAAFTVLLVLAVILLWGMDWIEKHMLELYRYYIAFNICGMLYLAARVLLGQSGMQCMAGDESYPMVWILAVAFTLVTGLQFLYCVVCWRKEWKLEGRKAGEKCTEEYVKGEEEQSAVAAAEEREERGKSSFNGRDIVFLLLFTLGYAVIVFFRLGSMEAPQSYIRLSNESEQDRQMIFRFGEDVELEEICIYLGVKAKKEISFSYYDFDADKWEVFESKRQIKSVFTWNKVPLNLTIRTLAMVLVDDEVYIHEIVFLDKNGRRVLPVNWKDYEVVFDEQELFPEYTTYYEGTMFDEVYHARTAYEFRNRLPLYEITHPPLGKLMISIGIWVFGMTPFGWRVICALCGTAMVPLMYLFVRCISGQRKYAVFGTALFCFEFMHLTLSRISTLDIIVAFFVLGMFYFMYIAIANLRKEAVTRKSAVYLLICGMFSACAVSTKWTGFYALGGIAVLFLGYVVCEYASSWEKLQQNGKLLIKLCGICVIAFVFLPVVVYFTSYIPYTWCGNQDSFIKITVENFKYMLNYHQNTVAEHPYSSEWYEWLWDKRPLLDALRSVSDGKIVSVATFGNPVIWLGGLGAFIHNIYLWRCRKEKTAAYLCIAYLSMLLPWLFIYRTVFIYQYFICSNMLILLLVNSFYHMEKHRRKAMLGFGLAAGVLFVFFYPVLTGYPVTVNYINQGLEWLRSWVLA